jgi:hypothetical protein
VVVVVDVEVVVVAEIDVATVVGAIVVEDVATGSDVEVEAELVEHAERRRSVAIAAPKRLNDRQESPSPINRRRGLTGLPPTSVAPPNIPIDGRTCGRFLRGRISPV